MAPKVCVPMDFGRHLIGSPTHSNLKLNTSEGGEVGASSVILSFNSPVIDHMTTTLHMTSVDMFEFSEAAVQLFVDAAYSGTPEGMSRQVFRDINKLASVFEVTWLVGKCAEYFTEVAESVEIPSYTELLYLFEEAAFVFENLKNKDFLKISINKIEMLNWKQEFIEKYLENADRLSTQKLDMVIELAGCEVECVVQTVSNQLLEVLKVQGSINIPASCEYLLDNLNLSLCFTSNRVLFNQLLKALKGLPDEKMRWCFELVSRSSEISTVDDHSAATASEVRSTNVVSRCNTIPNIYHDLDFNLSFEELLEWISVSENVTSLMMTIEAVWTWCWYRYKYQNITYTVNSNILFLKLADIAGRRGWSLLPSEFNTYKIHLVCSILNLAPFLLSQGKKNNHVIINCVGTCKQPLLLLSKEAKLKFHFKHPSVTSCTLPGKCGFILKTVPSEAALWTLRLCTEKEDYDNESVHFHDEVQAENMHLYICRILCSGTYLYPISWLGWLYSTDGVDKRNEWESNWSYGDKSRFKVLYKI